MYHKKTQQIIGFLILCIITFQNFLEIGFCVRFQIKIYSVESTR
jgi:hypothetical protein